MVYPGQASCWYDPRRPHHESALTLDHLRVQSLGWFVLWDWAWGLRPWGLIFTWEMQEFEGERIFDDLLVKVVKGTRPISQQDSTHCTEHQEGY